MRAHLSFVAFVAFVTLTASCGDPIRTIDTSGTDFAVVLPDLTVIRDLASPCGECPAETPVCDSKTKKCVACVSDSDCPVTTICQSGKCVTGCSAQRGQCGDAGACDVDLGLCRGCNTDKECVDPKRPVCDRDSGRCAPCTAQSDRCPDGQYCAAAGGSWACQPGCKADPDCQQFGAAGRCCNHACADTKSDKANCGSCGAACAMNQSCCLGGCAGLDSDIKNCGGCGKACSAPNATPVCAGGVCAVGQCLPGYSDCDKSPQNGCEVSTASDGKNCGACGNVCAMPNANPGCLNGACLILSCVQGYRNCNGNAGDGCEVSINSDPLNCGACGSACGNLPHAMAGCMNGGCVVGSCANGFGNCDKMDANGCEADFSMDPANCGVCAKACPVPAHANATCAAGVCGVLGCQPGWSDCDNNMANGCEINISGDPKSCGGCGMACPVPPNSTATCVNSICGISCVAGFADCDKNPQNGCEVDTRVDANNCGACGMACPNGQPCQNSMCGVINNCGGYAYPGTTFVNNTTCTGWFAGCTNMREFRAVGCYVNPPLASDCPPGFTVATLMLIGQWAQAANITRFQSGTSVCMYSGGSSNTAACGGTHTSAYCWPKNTPCGPGCGSNCCPPAGPCSAANYQAPLLCVK